MKDFITFEHISKPMLFPKKNMFTEDWATAISVYIGEVGLESLTYIERN